MQKITKRILGVIIATALMVTGINVSSITPSLAAGQVVKNTGVDKNTTMSSEGYALDHQYVKPGDTLGVTKDGVAVTENVKWTIQKVASAEAEDRVTYTEVAVKTAPTLSIVNDYLETIIYGEIGGQKLTVYCSKTPVIYMNSNTNYYDVTKSNYSEATMNLVGSEDFSDSQYWYNGKCEVKLRGNSTSLRPKRPFKLKLDKKADLLNLGDENGKSIKSKHWVLLANDIDHSLMRNKLLYDFSGEIGTDVYFKSTNVTLIYNGQYEGVYQLCEHRRVDEGRIDITNWTKYGETFAENIAKKLATEYAEKNGLEIESEEVVAWKNTKEDELKEAMNRDYQWMDTGEVTVFNSEESSPTKYLTKDGVKCTSLVCGSPVGASGQRADSLTIENNKPIVLTFRNDGYNGAHQNYENFALFFYDNNAKNNGVVFVGNGTAWWRNATQSWQGELGNSCTDSGMTVLDDAIVTLTILKSGNTIRVNGTAEGKDGNTATITCSATSTSGMQDNIVLQLGGEQCTLSDISYKEANMISKTYNLKELDSKTWNKMPTERDGGYLAEMDFYSMSDGSLPTMQTAYAQPLYVSAPEPGDGAGFKDTELFKFANKYTQAFEFALHSNDFVFRNTDTKYKAQVNWNNASYLAYSYKDDAYDGKHYSDLFDMDSLVNNFIFCEYAMNWDSMKNSFFYYKDLGEKAKIAPQWDFDWCWGNTNMYNINTNYPTKWHTTNEEFTVEQYYQKVQWNRMLIRDPYFIAKAYEKYKSVRPMIENMIKQDGTIDQYLAKWKEAGASNDNRWGYTYNGENYGGATPQNFVDSVAKIKSFLNTRVAWLDKQFASIETLTKSLGYYTPSALLTLTAVRSGDSLIVKAECDDEEAVQLAFQINGTKIVKADLKNGKAYVSIKTSELATDCLNTIVVNEIKDGGKYITTAGVLGKQVYANPKSNYVNVDVNALTADDGTIGKEYQAFVGKPTSNTGSTNTGSNNNATSNGGTKVNPTLTLNVTNLTMQKGKSCTGIVASGMIAGDKVASYKSSKESVVKVTSTGKMTAKALGTATITVTTKLGAKKSFTVKVQKGAVKTKKITLPKKTITLKKGKKYTIKPQLNPISASEKIKYKTNKKAIAVVSSKGVVKAKKKGTAKITVKSGKKKVVLKVKVK